MTNYERVHLSESKKKKKCISHLCVQLSLGYDSEKGSMNFD